MMWRYCTPGWKDTSPPNSACKAVTISVAASLAGCPPAKSSIVPSAPTLTRLQRYATWSGASCNPMAAASMDARPLW